MTLCLNWCQIKCHFAQELQSVYVQWLWWIAYQFFKSSLNWWIWYWYYQLLGHLLQIIALLLTVPYPELLWSQYIGLGSQTQTHKTLKSLDFWSKLSSTFLVTEPREWCFELFRMQNSQKFPGFHPWTPLGSTCSTTPDSMAAQQFFSLLCSSKNQHTPKIAGYGTA